MIQVIERAKAVKAESQYFKWPRPNGEGGEILGMTLEFAIEGLKSCIVILDKEQSLSLLHQLHGEYRRIEGIDFEPAAVPLREE